MISLQLTTEPLASGLTFRGDRMIVHLTDQREITLPLAHYPTLMMMTEQEREQWERIGGGEGFHWASHDLDLSVRGFLQGNHEHIPSAEWYKKRGLADPLKRS